MDNEGDDVVLEVGGKLFNCSRKELSNESAYFNAMFNGTFMERDKKSVKIQDVDAKAMENILSFIKDNSFFIEPTDLLLTLEGCCLLQMNSLKSKCLDRIIQDLNVDNCLKTWQTANQLDLERLRKISLSKAVLYFNDVKGNDNFMEMDLKALHCYLSNANLCCDNEMDVFEYAMQWWYEYQLSRDKKKDFDATEEQKTDYLMILLSCLNYGALSKADLRTMKQYPDVKKNAAVTSILDYLIGGNSSDKEINEETETMGKAFAAAKPRLLKIIPCFLLMKNFDRKENYAVKLYKSEDRAKTKVIEVEHVQTEMVWFYNENSQKVSQILNIFPGRGLHLEGYQLLAYKEKVLMLGGEYMIGSGNWNLHCWEYDTLKEKWELLTVMPSGRRHFRPCIARDCLYIIGGTGKFRVLQDNMMRYSLVENKWLTNITLPGSLSDIKCCVHEDKLLLMPGNLSNKFCYLFNEGFLSWQMLELSDPEKLITNYPTVFSIYSYNGYIYVYGKTLIKLQLLNNVLKVIDCETIDFEDCEEVAICTIKDVLFILCKYSDFDLEPDKYCSLKSFCLNTKKHSVLFSMNKNEERCNMSIGCFSMFHYNFVSENDTISSCEQLFK